MSNSLIKLFVILGSLVVLSGLGLFYVWSLKKMGLEVNGKMSILQKAKSFKVRLEVFGSLLMIVGMPMVFVYFAFWIAKDLPGAVTTIMRS